MNDTNTDTQAEAAPTGDTVDEETVELTVGSIIEHKDSETKYELLDDDDLGVIATEIGDRELTEKHVPEVGDECIVPDCNGEIKSVNDRRMCSNGCLEWYRTTVTDGDDCDKYGDRCDGALNVTVTNDGSVEYECDTCSRNGWSANITWREAWLPQHDS